MLENLLITINDFIQDEFWLSMLGCFAWGIVSTLLSPCHLASTPLLVCYVAGQPVSTKPRRAAGYAVCFSAKELHGHRPFLLLCLQHLQSMLIAVIDALITDHF